MSTVTNNNDLILGAYWTFGDQVWTAGGISDLVGTNLGMQKAMAPCNLIVGGLGVSVGLQQCLQAKKLHDREGVGLGVIRVTQGATSFSSGIVSGIRQGLTSTMTKVASIMEKVSAGLGCLSYALLSTNSFISLFHAIGLKRKISILSKQEAYKSLLQLAKTPAYLRYAGSDSYALICEELKKPVEEQGSEAVIDRILHLVHKETKNKIITEGIILAAALIGLVGIIIATVFSGGVPFFLALGMLLLSTVAIGVFDAKDFAAEVAKTQKVSQRDKMLLAILLIITVVAMVLGIIFSGGTSAMILTLALGTTTLLVQLSTIIYIWKKRCTNVAADS